MRTATVFREKSKGITPSCGQYGAFAFWTVGLLSLIEFGCRAAAENAPRHPDAEAAAESAPQEQECSPKPGCSFNSDKSEDAFFEFPAICDDYMKSDGAGNEESGACNAEFFVATQRELTRFKSSKTSAEAAGVFKSDKDRKQLVSMVSQAELAALLALSREPYLEQTRSENASIFRLILQRSHFIRPELSFLVVRVERSGDRFRVITKKQPARLSTPENWKYDCSIQIRSIRKEQWETLIQKAEDVSFWALPWQEEQERIIRHGVAWYLEGTNGALQKRTYRLSPDASTDLAAYSEMAHYILQLGGIADDEY